MRRLINLWRRLPYFLLSWLLDRVPTGRLKNFLVETAARRARSLSPADGLRFLFSLDAALYSSQEQLTIAYGGGIHVKHHHTHYHDFFIKNIHPGQKVLDIGCGNGFMSYDMVNQVSEVRVMGIELNEANIKFARAHYQHHNLIFIHGDALKELPNERFDVVTLSNVLEHIEPRVEFLKKIMQQIRPKRFIIRVPLFERDWRVPLKKELGIDYRLDPTHFVEYTQEGYFEELRQAGLKVTYVEFRWGEIWSVVEPLYNADGINAKKS